MTRYPNLYLAGAPKCGTTSLAYYLGQHPEIFTPIMKEPVYFGSDLTTDGRRMSLQEYQALFQGWDREAYALDASTPIHFSERAASQIKAARSDAKILIAVRNPVDAAYSMYFQCRYQGAETADSFEQAFAAMKERIAAPKPSGYGYYESLIYRRVYAYSQNIKRYVDAFGRENIHVSAFDDIKKDPASEVRAILDFLGLDPALVENFDFDAKNSSKKARLGALRKLYADPPKWIGWFSKPLLSSSSRIQLKAWLQRLNTAPSQYPPMTLETRAMLEREFSDEIEWLAEFLGRDLSGWFKVTNHE